MKKKLIIEDTSQIKAEISRIRQSGQPLAYWESQNPAYVGMLALLIPVVLFIVAVISWSEMAWLSILMIFTGLGLALIYGGFRTLVTRDTVTVKMGILGIQLLHLKTAEITAGRYILLLPSEILEGTEYVSIVICRLLSLKVTAV
ncbi:MAG: hypothetical protein NT082_04640 [Chloroflexi bacterium]|nr:hypothetical protein [Chloroflexota bacterium]